MKKYSKFIETIKYVSGIAYVFAFVWATGDARTPVILVSFMVWLISAILYKKVEE